MVLTLLPGAELYINVEHAKGTFRVPSEASALDVYSLAMEGTNEKGRQRLNAAGTIRISRAEYRALIQCRDDMAEFTRATTPSLGRVRRERGSAL